MAPTEIRYSDVLSRAVARLWWCVGSPGQQGKLRQQEGRRGDQGLPHRHPGASTLELRAAPPCPLQDKAEQKVSGPEAGNPPAAQVQG